MLRPPRALPSNAHIAILAASGPSDRARIEAGARAIERYGHRVTLAPNIDHRHRGYLAGDDEERAAELNRFLRSDAYDAFFFARGGYGAMRILDRIDYSAMAANPRPLVGFSDVTALHQALAMKTGVASFHGPMVNLDFNNGLSQEVEQWFWSMLRGDAPLTWTLNADDVLNEGEVEGVLFGGCLALITSLVGTPYDFWIDDGIWFWEDVDEPVYRVDRMLTHLRLSGRMQRVRGVVIGALKDCGNDAEMQVFLRDFFTPLGIPVVRNLPIGHHGNNLLMPIGRTARLSTSHLTFTVTEPAVTR
ncbi:MAG TPA: LD-carboxypeptidase [Thermoanaerobaculia bacterium]|nr:LD-carboxypeptidase [Thermoanaerobaculia bacterium]